MRKETELKQQTKVQEDLEKILEKYIDLLKEEIGQNEEFKGYFASVKITTSEAVFELSVDCKPYKEPK